MKNISEKMLLGILLVLGIAFGIMLSGRFESLSNQINDLRAIASDQNRQTGNLYSQIEGLLKKNASIIDSYEITYGGINSENMTFDVRLSVSPKEFGDKTSASYSIGSTRGAMTREGNVFSAVIDLPISEEGRPSVIFSENGQNRSETIEYTVSFRQNYLYKLKCDYSGNKSYSGKKLGYSGNIVVAFDPSQGFAPKSGRLLATVDGAEVFSEDIPVTSQNINNIEFRQTFALDSGEIFALYAEVKDENGLTYRYVVDSTVVSPDGPISENFMRGECIILDKNGNEIKFS